MRTNFSSFLFILESRISRPCMNSSNWIFEQSVTKYETSCHVCFSSVDFLRRYPNLFHHLLTSARIRKVINFSTLSINLISSADDFVSDGELEGTFYAFSWWKPTKGWSLKGLSHWLGAMLTSIPLSCLFSSFYTFIKLKVRRSTFLFRPDIDMKETFLVVKRRWNLIK